MQIRYMEACLRLPPQSVFVLERQFSLPRKGSLFFRLRACEVDHADVVLTLLHAGHWESVEILIGHEITICPPCLTRYRTPPVPVRDNPDEGKIISFIARNPRLPTTPSFQRFRILKEGMTLKSALVRGVRRRDLREWLAEGSIKVENVS